MVTLEGTLINKAGLITGGEPELSLSTPDVEETVEYNTPESDFSLSMDEPDLAVEDVDVTEEDGEDELEITTEPAEVNEEEAEDAEIEIDELDVRVNEEEADGKNVMIFSIALLGVIVFVVLIAFICQKTETLSDQ